MNWTLRFEKRFSQSIVIVELNGEAMGAFTATEDEFRNFNATFHAGRDALKSREFDWNVK